MKRRKFSKKTARANRRRRLAAPQTLEQFSAKPQRFQKIWNRVIHVITKMRKESVSLQQASRDQQIDRRTVARLGGTALRRLPNGRYVAKRSDRLLRVLTLPSSEGLREIAIRDSRQATEIATYSSVVDRYLQTGDASRLQKFAGKHITDASGVEVPLLTDLKELDRLGSAGVLSFESLYRRAS